MKNPKVDHNYKGEKSDSGYEEGRFWRNTKAHISYHLINKKLEGKYLLINVLDNFKAEDLTLTINKKPIEITSFENKIIQVKTPETEQLSKILMLKISTNRGEYSPRIHQICLTTKL